MIPIRRKMTSVVVVVLVAATAACIDGDYVTVAGRPYDTHAVATLRPGDDASTIRSRVGEPITITPTAGDRQEWRFYWRGTRTSWAGHGKVRVKTGAGSAHSEAIVEIEGGRVRRIVKNEPWVYE